jgi:hypothetical protein
VTASCLNAACLLLAAIAWGGKDKPGNLTQPWISGQYEFADVTITNAPLYRPDGSTWDPHSGLADLYLIVYTTPGGADEWQEGIITSYVEGAGSDAELADWILFIIGPEDADPETRWLFFQVIDYDPDNLEIVDESRSISIDDLSPSGRNSIVCERGTEITFSTSWIGLWE